MSYEFSQSEIDQLKYYRDEQEDARLKSRFIALILLAEGLSLAGVSSAIGKSTRTIDNWYQHYRSKGIEALNNFQYKPGEPKLSESQQEQLSEWIESQQVPAAKIIQEYVHQQFGVQYTIDGIRKLIKKKSSNGSNLI